MLSVDFCVPFAYNNGDEAPHTSACVCKQVSQWELLPFVEEMNIGMGDKMNKVIQYHGYFTSVQYSQEDQIFFGKIGGIRDLVTFECENASEAEQAFKDAVDDYLEFCEEDGKDPNKSFSGHSM
mgnify:FL=1